MFLAFVLIALLLAPSSRADIAVEIGPTNIPRGNAIGERDITINNGIFAVAFAVETPPPWGVARGGILDIALVEDGKPGYDIASLADFMPNRWSSWPTSYQRVSLETVTAGTVVVKTARDWGDVELETMFRILDNDSTIQINTTMTNKGDAVLNDLMSGYVVWPDGGTLFGVPGLFGVNAGVEDDALAKWSVSYGDRWVLGLHAPFAEFVDYGGRDRYQKHQLKPGQSRLFEAWLQIEASASLAPIVTSDIERRQLESGHLRGRVRSMNGEDVTNPAVILSIDGAPYAWTLGTDGRYEIELPVGQYEVFATAKAHAKGAAKTISIRPNRSVQLDLDDVGPPGNIRFQIADASNGKPLDARISIDDGYKPLLGHFGKYTFFTDLTDVGVVNASMAPGRYVFKVSAGSGFTSTPVFVEATVESGKMLQLEARVTTVVRPEASGWYSADLHHHSDVLDGFTAAEYVLRSELAAGINIAFLSDHDSVVNNEKMRRLAASRNTPFIAGTELSPSWAHFNAFPLHDDAMVEIDTGAASVQEIFSAARKMGAALIEANHPYSEYGYFNNDEQDSIPGGYSSGFDLAEIVPGNAASNTKTVQRVWRLWNERQRIYLAGGSDAHDVWQEESGAARTYAHIDGALTIDKYVAALKAGHSYASQGPLVFPDTMFGDVIPCTANATLMLSQSVLAVSGLRSVQLVERGEIIDEQVFAGETDAIRADFHVRPAMDTWYSLVIEDSQGKFAYTNPIWVTVDK